MNKFRTIILGTVIFITALSGGYLVGFAKTINLGGAPGDMIYTPGAINAAGGMQWNGQSMDSRYASAGNVGAFGQITLHGAFPDFNTDPGYWGWTYNIGNTNGPPDGRSQGGYRERIGLGSEYGRTSYALDLNVPRTSQGGSGVGYIWMRQEEAGSWGSWSKINAGYADTAGSATTLSASGSGGRVSYPTDDSGLHVINAEGSASNVRLGAAWGRPGIYNNPNITIGSEGTIYFVTQNVERGRIDSNGNMYIPGTLTAGTISGGYSGTITSGNVSSGSFGSNTGGGNYTFPASLTVNGSILGNQYASMIIVSGGGNGWYGMGTSDASGGATPVGGFYPYAINNHTGLALSAHSAYGGIRFYNQNYPANPLGVMAMQITNNNVSVVNALSVGGAVSAASFSGSGAGLTGTAASLTAGSANFVNGPDGDRNAATKLPTTSGHGVRFDFVTANTANGGGNYSGLMTYAPWDGTSGSTGDASYQIAFDSPGTNGSGVPYLSIRNGVNSTWNPWYAMLNTGNYQNYSPTLTGAGASGTWGINITGNAGSATSYSGTITSGNVSSGSFGSNTGGGNYSFPANIYPNNQSTYGLKGNDGYFDTLNTGLTNDPLEINYRTAGPVKICASVNCATYSAYFDTSGNVGIGTTGPGNFKLQVAGDIGPNVDTTYYLGDSAHRFAGLYANSIDGGAGGLTINSGSGMYFSSGDIVREVMSSTGNFGIGTFFRTDPNYRLTTSGGGIKAETSDASQPAGYFNNLSTGPALIVANGGLTISSLAGVGSRCLHIDASGVVSATASDCGSGTTRGVTSVTASLPLSSSGGVAPNISIPAANGTTDGFLSSADWNTFNGKQNALGYTPVNKAGDTMTGALEVSSGITDSLFRLTRVGATYPTIFREGTDGALVVNNGSIDTVTLKGGSVGIGTSDPSGTLHLHSVGQPYLHLSNNQTGMGIGRGGGLQLQNGSPTVLSLGNIETNGITIIAANMSGGSIEFYAGGGGIPKMKVASNGNVGIGNPGPGYKLDVSGFINGNQICIAGDCRAAWPSGGVTSVASGAGLTGGPITSSGTLSIATGGVTNAMLANSSLAQVKNHTGSYTSLDISGSGAGYSGFNFTDVTGNGGRLMVHNTADVQGFYNETVGWSWYFQNGALTAGTVPWTRITGAPAFITNETDPSVSAWAKAASPPTETDPTVPAAAKAMDQYVNTNSFVTFNSAVMSGLTINGNTYAQFLSTQDIYVQGVITVPNPARYSSIAGNFTVGSPGWGNFLQVNGDIYHTGFIANNSDQRLKKDIRPMDGLLSKILEINPATFNWRWEEFPDKHLSQKRQIGVIAQEVERAFPELVHIGPDGYKTVEYDKLSVIALEAIKELKSENDMLKARIKALEDKINALPPSRTGSLTGN